MTFDFANKRAIFPWDACVIVCKACDIVHEWRVLARARVHILINAWARIIISHDMAKRTGCASNTITVRINRRIHACLVRRSGTRSAQIADARRKNRKKIHNRDLFMMSPWIRTQIGRETKEKIGPVINDKFIFTSPVLAINKMERDWLGVSAVHSVGRDSDSGRFNSHWHSCFVSHLGTRLFPHSCNI